MFDSNSFFNKSDRKVIITPVKAPPPPNSIDEFSPVCRKVLNEVYREFRIKYPHIFGTDHNNNDEPSDSSSFQNENLSDIQLTIDNTRRNKRKIQHAEENYLKIVGKSETVPKPTTSGEISPKFECESPQSPKMIFKKPKRYNFIQSKIDINLLNQINDTIADYNISDRSVNQNSSPIKKGKIIVHENIIIKPADNKEASKSRLQNILQKFAYKPKPKDKDGIEEGFSTKEKKVITFFDTPSFKEPRKRQNLNETLDSMSEKILSATPNMKSNLNLEEPSSQESSIPETKNFESQSFGILSIPETQFSIDQNKKFENFTFNQIFDENQKKSLHQVKMKTKIENPGPSCSEIENQKPFLDKDKYSYINKWYNSSIFDFGEDELGDVDPEAKSKFENGINFGTGNNIDQYDKPITNISEPKKKGSPILATSKHLNYKFEKLNKRDVKNDFKVVKKGFYNIEVDKSKPAKKVNYVQTKITNLLKPKNNC